MEKLSEAEAWVLAHKMWTAPYATTVDGHSNVFTTLYGLCFTLKAFVTKGVISTETFREMKARLEFFRPEGAYGYWWPEGDRESRAACARKLAIRTGAAFDPMSEREAWEFLSSLWLSETTAYTVAGICNAINQLANYGKITEETCVAMRRRLRRNKPWSIWWRGLFAGNSYWWPLTDRESRAAFCTKLGAKLP